VKRSANSRMLKLIAEYSLVFKYSGNDCTDFQIFSIYLPPDLFLEFKNCKYDQNF